MKFTELNRDEFIKFSSNYPYSMFFQSPYWMDIKKDNGWNGKIVGLKNDKDEIVAATVLLFKKLSIVNKNMVYAPRGFLLDYSNKELLTEFVSEIKKYLKKEKALFLKINPYVKYQERNVNGEVVGEPNNEIIDTLSKLGFKHQGFYITTDEKKDLEPRWLSVLNIENIEIDDLFKNMESTTRWSIRNSEKNDLRIIECNREELKEFKALMQHTADRRNFIDRPLEYYEKIYDVLAKEDLVKVLLVEINFKELLDKNIEDKTRLQEKIDRIKDNPKKSGELKELTSQLEPLEKRINDLKKFNDEYNGKRIIAGGLYMLYGRQLIYLFGASYKEFMKYNSQYLLQWEMIKYAKEHNYQTFNFYGIDGDFRKESKNYGLFDFKRGFNAEVVELIGEFDLVINKPMYVLYNVAFKLYKALKKIKNK